MNNLRNILEEKYLMFNKKTKLGRYYRMKIIIDGRMINRKLHGIGRYTYELVNGLALEQDVSIKLLTNNENESKEIFGENEKIELINIKSKFLSPLEIIEIPLKINKYKGEYIYHSPSFSASPFIKLKSFITIHDLNHLALPQYYSKFHKYYYEHIVKPFALKCNKIFTVSQFSKGEIIKWLKCDEEKVVVTYNGIDEKFKIIKDTNILNKVKNKYKLPEEFVLYIGNLKPHKNVGTLVKAMKGVREGIKLIINGKANEELKSIINEYKLQEKIQFIGYVDEEDLPSMYNLASIFVFPSLYEGFGLPPLEAMACGCRVIVSNTTSLPEVVGENGIKIDVRNEKNIELEINRLITEKNKMKYDRNIKFSWGKLVDDTYKILHNI